MELIDNINRLLGDDLKQTLKPGARLKIAASCFSMYAFEALKAELEKIDELQFIFTSPTFTANEVTDKIRKERREFHIPKADRERSLYGSEFEIQLRNKLTQRAIAKRVRGLDAAQGNIQVQSQQGTDAAIYLHSGCCRRYCLHATARLYRRRSRLPAGQRCLQLRQQDGRADIYGDLPQSV